MKLLMKNENKIFNKKILLEKEKGENIILGAGDGSGRSGILLCMFNEMIKSKSIGTSSIFINLLGDNGFMAQLVSLLTNHNISVEDDFFLFNSLTKGLPFEFKDIDFKDPTVYNFIKDKHVLLSLPCIERISFEEGRPILDKMYEFIENLPINEGKEIPIFIEYFPNFKEDDFNKYIDLVKMSNKKGYFFVTITYGMFNFYDFNTQFPILQDTHRHFLMAHSQLNLDNKFMKDIHLKKPLNELDCGYFYYLKDFELQNKETFRFDLYDFSLMEVIPKLLTQEALVKPI